ncbi:hypothetical protein H2198_006799 [Neophaeococcomyces mojaviensis]|uniref:Uncharacterized protein n=1 Tax=Neophaeococcomyces mojaviensis TaxID=3383035 RepID=A0ACC3A243_9EURO|nr:hypothetical protein H2198_006799 [Knufia sp. JES_112]
MKTTLIVGALATIASALTYSGSMTGPDGLWTGTSSCTLAVCTAPASNPYYTSIATTTKPIPAFTTFSWSSSSKCTQDVCTRVASNPYASGIATSGKPSNWTTSVVTTSQSGSSVSATSSTASPSTATSSGSTHAAVPVTSGPSSVAPSTSATKSASFSATTYAGAAARKDITIGLIAAAGLVFAL